MKVVLDRGAFAPERAHGTDAGLDLRSPKDITVPAHGSAVIDTGVHVEIPFSCAGFLKSKSGLNVKHGITSEGVIDTGYTGSIVAKLYNNSSKDYHVKRGDKITQVVGRAGRGSARGRAVIQTMTPENQVLLQAARQDYDAFYRSELSLRELRYCPPYADVLQVKFFGVFENEVADGAFLFRQALNQGLREETFRDQRILVMGPAPAPVVRVMNRYHYRLTILAKNTKELRSLLSSLLKWFAGDRRSGHITACVDVNPLS